MRIPSTIILAITGILIFSGFVFKEEGWVVGPETNLVIYGATNVNSFKCKMDCYSKLDTLSYMMDDDKCMILFKGTVLSIPVTNFDCANKLINKDFYETLKSDQYPYVKIQFVALERWKGNSHVGGTAYITLAGVTRPFIISYDVKSTSSVLLLKGYQKMCFSDFGLEPPKKMMGMIKVQDGLDVEFQLVLRAI